MLPFHNDVNSFPRRCTHIAQTFMLTYWTRGMLTTSTPSSLVTFPRPAVAFVCVYTSPSNAFCLIHSPFQHSSHPFTCNSQFASATASVPLLTATLSPVRLACSARTVAVLSAITRPSAGTLSPTCMCTMSPGSSSRAGRSLTCRQTDRQTGAHEIQYEW